MLQNILVKSVKKMAILILGQSMWNHLLMKIIQILLRKSNLNFMTVMLTRTGLLRNMRFHLFEESRVTITIDSNICNHNFQATALWGQWNWLGWVWSCYTDPFPRSFWKTCKLAFALALFLLLTNDMFKILCALILKVTCYHILKLFQPGQDPSAPVQVKKFVRSESYDEIIFQEPTIFMKSLLDQVKSLPGEVVHDTDCKLMMLY